MKSRYIFLFILLFLSFSNVNAQIFLSLDDFSQRMRRNDKPKIITERINKIEGNAFAQEDFINGKIIQYDGVTFIDIPLKYNIYNDQLEFENDRGISYYISNPKEFKEFVIGEQRYIFGNYIDGKKERAGVYEIIQDGAVLLIKKERILVEDSEPARYYDKAKPARFKHLPADYYIVKDRMYIHRLKSIKGAIKLLGKYNDALLNFSKQHKLKVTNEADLSKLISFYNSENS